MVIKADTRSDPLERACDGIGDGVPPADDGLIGFKVQFKETNGPRSFQNSRYKTD